MRRVKPNAITGPDPDEDDYDEPPVIPPNRLERNAAVVKLVEVDGEIEIEDTFWACHELSYSCEDDLKEFLHIYTPRDYPDELVLGEGPWIIEGVFSFHKDWTDYGYEYDTEFDWVVTHIGDEAKIDDLYELVRTEAGGPRSDEG